MKQTLLLLAGLLAVMAPMACSTAPRTPNQKADLQDEGEVAMRRFERTDASLRTVLDRSYGYVLFPDIGKGGFIAGAAYGRGLVYEQGNFIGYADIRQGSVGAQVGGQNFAELIVFQTKEALYKLKQNNFTFGANATAIGLKANAGAAAEFKDGVAVFVMPKGGLMAEASISGQKFTFVPRDVAETDQRRAATQTGTRTRTEIRETREVREKSDRLD
jgi:lipid-binding SYLF domain-containing protein